MSNNKSKYFTLEFAVICQVNFKFNHDSVVLLLQGRKLIFKMILHVHDLKYHQITLETLRIRAWVKYYARHHLNTGGGVGRDRYKCKSG